MMYQRFKIRIFVVVLVLFGAIFGFVVYSNSTKTLEVVVGYENSRDVMIYDLQETVGDGNRKLVASITESGQTTRLKKGHPYVITYAGNEGYGAGEIMLNSLMSSETITIKPFFSDTKLATLLDATRGDTSAVIGGAYPKINMYTIQPGKLYHYGEWFGTTLKFIGDDNFNDDTLRVALHKEDGAWVIKTGPPSITLSKHFFKDVPEDILKDINSL